MKTEEDEAFDELARKQGAWGGGYRAKRQAAADKFQEPIYKITVIDNAHPKGIPFEDWVQPAQRPWVGLTDEDIEGCVHHVDDGAVFGLPDFARAVEQLLKEKNNGP